MDCLDDLETNTRGINDNRLASKFSELAQALSDLGLHTHALTTSSLAYPYAMTSDDSRLNLALVLSLQANILCDLKRNDESINAAEKVVTLCNEHRDSQSVPVPVPEIAYALLNYSVLLCSFGLKDEGAAVALELQGEVDGNSQPDMKHISALSRLCLSITRIGADDELALSTNEEAINLSRGSSDADWQTTLAGALLIKSKILSSMKQDEAACPFSAEAINLLRTLRIERPLFSLFLADALDTHAHHLSEANRKGEAFLTSRDAVELWQTLRTSVPGQPYDVWLGPFSDWLGSVKMVATRMKNSKLPKLPSPFSATYLPLMPLALAKHSICMRIAYSNSKKSKMLLLLPKSRFTIFRKHVPNQGRKSTVSILYSRSHSRRLVLPVRNVPTMRLNTQSKLFKCNTNERLQMIRTIPLTYASCCWTFWPEPWR
ncbi:hypothetical protein BGW80DRAFT_923476 [Lactifluus volemus]|nr:hypothetical protein BGW80DRAFT_923476 [Lactifluus volemus]